MNKETKKLVISYMAIIMTLSIIFSVLVYVVFSSQLGKPLPPQRPRFQQMNTLHERDDEISESIQSRINERDENAKESVIASLILLNIAMLIGGFAVSYMLARKTLGPIEAAMQKQEQFVSDASHELRTPLTALLTTNEVALRKKSLSSEDTKKILQTTIDEVKSLRSLTDSMLDVSRADSTPRTVTKANIRTLSEKVLQRFEHTAKERSQILKNEIESIDMEVCDLELSQIVSIYVDNALKYSPKKSTIELSSKQTGHSVIVSVTDQGGGIQEKDSEAIFERFYRIDSSRSQSASGHGLGLSIARKLADACGYSLHVTSSEKNGTTFSVEIPIR